MRARTLYRSRHRRAARGGALEKVDFLSDGRHLLARSCRVRVIETHFAWIFLAGRRAYKLKKPMRQASMDYRSLASREAGCREELRLNLRLAPRVYRRVVPLVRRRTGALALGGPGTRVDWLIEMRRLPAARMLDRVLVRGAPRAGDLVRLIEALGRFFEIAERRPLGDGAYLARLGRQIRGNARELRARDLDLDRPLVDAVVKALLRFLSAGRAALAGRGARLLDGHGDLRPEHVYLGSPASRACVIDCLEFDPDLRRLDPAEEMAFLALECERLGAGRFGRELVARYRRRLADPLPEPLLRFYMCRRAAVRAQITAWHLRDPDFADDWPSWKARAHSYLADALRQARLAYAALGSAMPATPGGRGPRTGPGRGRTAGATAVHAPGPCRSRR